ncbi:MAG: glycogen/starch/alpha-glucan phosphorylase [Oscillospiraceae bacterium]|jgi:starch phosphorylase|nr:glycogen/starch/alpha-glucan phosphorylase [Oscillospiraceae bacterium]
MQSNNTQELYAEIERIKQAILGKLQRHHGATLKDATPFQLYRSIVSTVRDQIMAQLADSRARQKDRHSRKLYYLSVEFLLGRSLHANILNLLATGAYQAVLTELGIRMEDMLREESEPGLGNGGLGRLAACFMDSLATLRLPAMGCTIRYEYGLFRQRIIDGQQVELPDNWLEFGNAWEMPALEDSVEVHFGGRLEEEWTDGKLTLNHVEYKTVMAVPYDMPITGYSTDMVNTLRMWRARAPKSSEQPRFSPELYALAVEERELAETISGVLYPEDNNYEGKLLRLKQQYFLTSAMLQYILADFKRTYGEDLYDLPEKVVIHINDTHPAMAIPELMRLLMDQEGYGWDEAQAIVLRTVAYTNHTIMAEALEKWPDEMVRIQLPRVYQILEEINRRFCDRLWNLYPGQWDRIAKLAIIAYNQVHMANLAVWGSFSVNGVSQLHGEILKRDTFHDFYRIMPEKFCAITNGITHRRWLMLANPLLTTLVEDAIGDGWREEPERLIELKRFKDDAAFVDKYSQVKRKNKERLARWFEREQGVIIKPDFLFDVQAKRLHEYKRQLLNALHITVLYNRIVDDPEYEITPRCFIFSAKAAPSYRRAKQIIRLINAIGAMIEKHPRARSMLQVVFLENYSVSAAEILIPATELSEQISTATKEASGTGNMKFMMNGALTIGTMDGANVEMHDRVGSENIYIFGARAQEVEQIYATQSYQSINIFERNQEIRKALNQLLDRTVLPEQGAFQDIYHSLLFGDYGGMPDPFLVLKDFGSYSMAQQRVGSDYKNQKAWNKRAIVNTAMSGWFSSDRAIHEYNQLIWKLDPVDFED